ncbi:cytochrome b/b6 domain-containing protein [uncultured Pantoea sp.]|uniref:cytochrome b/b6 domain-containing protein n=1 Tax=uncultured Pantoea sp. TaxID=218084 RepID=UPI0025842CA6|nr:cytochrome b/b6 domain-containing protein [uncultured Pantoea sp.]
MLKTLLRSLPHDYAPFFRGLHISIALLIALQIINSDFIDADALSESGWPALMTWWHALSGGLLLILGLILLAWMIGQRGIRWYFSWAFVDFRQINADIRQLMQFTLPESSRGSIAATVQGLGVAALLLVAASGSAWFAAERLLPSLALYSGLFLHWHKFLTTFIETYFYAHGLMGVAHMFLRNKKQTAEIRSAE